MVNVINKCDLVKEAILYMQNGKHSEAMEFLEAYVTISKMETFHEIRQYDRAKEAQDDTIDYSTFSRWTQRALKRAKIRNWNQLEPMSDIEILDMNGFGEKSLHDIRAELKKRTGA
jgi:DNA-directed RNA polymerase alpha subunit